MGRSLPNTSDGIITEQKVTVNSQDWTVYSVGGSPAQAVLHGVLEVMPVKPDLIVSELKAWPLREHVSRRSYAVLEAHTRGGPTG